jgi:hypothetical protein
MNTKFSGIFTSRVTAFHPRVTTHLSRFALAMVCALTAFIVGLAPTNAQSSPLFAFSVGSLNTEQMVATVVSISFRDPSGNSYPDPGVRVELDLKGPASWGEEHISFRANQGWVNWNTNRRFLAGWYTLSGTVNNRLVSAQVWVDGTLSNALNTPRLRYVNVTGNLSDDVARSIDVNWIRVPGARQYLVRLLDENSRAVTTVWTRDTTVALGPTEGIAWFERYTVQVFAFDLETITPFPSLLPERFNASLMTHSIVPFDEF